MPKPMGLYLTSVVFFFLLLFRRLIREATERISTKLAHKFRLWLIFGKFGQNSTGIYIPPTCQSRFFAPSPWGQKRLWTLIEHMSATEHDINNRKEICQSTAGTPYTYAPKFGQLWSRNGWERWASFCPPPKFSHWETLPALPHGRHITDSRQTLARVV